MGISGKTMMLATALAIVLAGAAAEAKDNTGKGAKKVVPQGQVQRQKSGLKPIPPGQIKRYTRGEVLPGNLKFDEISDLSKWKLKPLGPGEKYVKIDNEVLKVARETNEVLDVVGDIADLAR